MHACSTIGFRRAYARRLAYMAGRAGLGSTSGETSQSVGSDRHTTTVSFFRHEIEVTFQWIWKEADRRCRHGLGALTNPEALRALMALPAGLPVPIGQIDPLDRLVLDEVPPGAVDDLGTQLVRRASPPVDLMQVSKRVCDWEDVQELSLLRTHAPRLAIASRPLADRIMRTCDPDMGVAVLADDGVAVKRPPGRRWVKPSWQRWLLAETVFAAAGGTQPIRLSHA